MATVILVQGGEDLGAKRIGKDNTATFGYQILFAADEFSAMEALDAAKPGAVTVRGVTLVFEEIKLKHIECETYEADVNYIHPDRQKNEDDENDDGPQLSMSIAGTTENITHSLKSVKAYPPAAFGKHEQAINVEKNAKGEIKIKGCSIQVATYKAKLSVKIPKPAQPLTFGQQIARCASKVADAPYGPFKKGEMYFLGGTLTGKLRDKWALEYEFEFQENITAAHNLKIGGLGPIEKEGWEYLWVEWQQVPKDGQYLGNGQVGPAIVAKVAAIHIEQIHYYFSLGDLGL